MHLKNTRKFEPKLLVDVKDAKMGKHERPEVNSTDSPRVEGSSHVRGSFFC